MATKPKIVTLTNSSVDILNAIRNNASVNYQNYVPVATANAESIREIGAIIMDYPALQNEFLNALVNRIGKVLVTSRSYSNPWAMFKKGQLDFGEAVEEAFVNLAKPFQYDPAVAEDKVFKREIPNVRSAFYIMNYQKFYKATIQQEQLRQAFLSWEGVTDLVAKIVESMYTAANYDEFQVMKYMLARHILNGRLYVKNTNSAPATYPKSVVADVKAISNKLTFMSPEYNLAHVHTSTLRENQYVLINSDFEAVMNVEVLASAFNMSKADFMGHVVLVDSFGSLDVTRLNTLFTDDDTYVEIGSSELEALDAIPLCVVDRDFFMIFDNLTNFTEQYNGEGLYWNYWYHVWKTFGISPFANAVVFVPGTSGITSVTIAPDAITVAQDFEGSIPLGVTVVTSGFASQEVTWSITTDISAYTKFHASVSASGVVTISHDASATYPESITIKATSVADSTADDTCVITLAAPEDADS